MPTVSKCEGNEVFCLGQQESLEMLSSQRKRLESGRL